MKFQRLLMLMLLAAALAAADEGSCSVLDDRTSDDPADPADPAALADALVRLLTDRALTERLAAGARPSVEPFVTTPEQYAESLSELVAAARTGQ